MNDQQLRITIAAALLPTLVPMCFLSKQPASLQRQRMAEALQLASLLIATAAEPTASAGDATEASP